MLIINRHFSKEKCLVAASNILLSVKKELERKMDKGDEFAVYSLQSLDEVDVVSFYHGKSKLSQEYLLLKFHKKMRRE